MSLGKSTLLCQPQILFRFSLQTHKSVATYENDLIQGAYTSMTEYSKYVTVNQRDPKKAIQAGVLPMQRNYDSAHDNLPYFQNIVSPQDFGDAHHASYSMSHVPGRWLNALLNAQDVLDVKVDEACIEALRTWTYRSYESENLGFPAMLDLQTLQPIRRIDLHNMRESMHALFALVAYRQDEHAFELAKTLIDSVNRYFDPQTCAFRYDTFHADTGAEEQYYTPNSSMRRSMGIDPDLPQQEVQKRMGVPLFARTFGRYIGPLVKLYRATGYEPALQQALQLKEACITQVLPADNSYTAARLGAHTHSVTAMLSSLAQLGEVVHDEAIMQRLVAFMENGLQEIALDFGWCLEGDQRQDLVGEVNNTSDIMEACLCLGGVGFERYYARAERILRGHFLPSQALDTSFIPNDDGPDERTSRMAWRVYGAFGFPTPLGHEDSPGSRISFNWDITGGAVGGLCEVLRRSLTQWGPDGVSINLLFDCENEFLRFRNPYDRDGQASITVQQPCHIRMRIPGNTNREGIRVNGCESYQAGEWLYLVGTQPGNTIDIALPFEEQVRTYTFRGHKLRFTWRGEEVIAADSTGKRLCFFPDSSAK